KYLGVDVGPGRDVDFLCSGEVLQLPTAYSDITLSTECFEHTAKWRDILLNMIRITKPRGLIVLTFAGRGRPAHGTLDSDVKDSPYTVDHYKNITVRELLDSDIALDHFFRQWSIEADNWMCDTYFWGLRSDHPYEETTDPKELESWLSRARGQLSQATEIIREKDLTIAQLNLDRRKTLIGAMRS